MENSIFFNLFMGFCKICVLLTWLLGLFFSFVFLPYYTVRSIIEIIKGKDSSTLSDSFINFWSAHGGN